MTIPISAELKKRFDNVELKTLIFGSKLFGVHDENSDTDIMHLYEYSDVFKIYTFLPNIHSFQFKDEINNTDHLYLTYEQFWASFYNGDGTMFSDIVLFNGWIEKDRALQMCKTYKIIKAYCGSAKRDITLNKTHDFKILRRSMKNLYIASCLLTNTYPTLEKIREIYQTIPDFKYMLELEQELRKVANDLFNQNTLQNYFVDYTNDELLNIMIGGNNLKEYKFEK